MDIRKLQRAIVDGLEDVKAQDIQVFNTEHLSPLFERVIIASGTSNRQTKALASSVRDAVRSHGMPVLGMEGGDNGEWIIVDCGAAVAHIMQPAIRDYYRLEEIWGGKPVKMKFGETASKTLPKASEPDEPEVPAAAKKAAPARKPVTAGAAAKKAAAKKQPAKPAPAKPASAKRATAKKAPSKKAASATKNVSAARQPAAKKTSARAPAARAPARQAARKAPVRG